MSFFPFTAGLASAAVVKTKTREEDLGLHALESIVEHMYCFVKGISLKFRHECGHLRKNAQITAVMA